MALTHPLTLALYSRERGLTPVRVRKLIQKGFGFLEIGRVKTLREPVVALFQALAGGVLLALLLPQPTQTHGCPQLQ
jgi:hypothetical protein